MRNVARGWSVAAGVLCGLALPGAAHGQAIGYRLDRFEPAPAGDAFSVVEYPWYRAARRFAVGLTFDYAYNLLVAEGRDPGGNVVRDVPIAHQQSGRLDVAAALHARIAVHASLPLTLAQDGTMFAGIGPRGMVAGDPRLGVRVRLTGVPNSALSLSAAAHVWIPIGAAGELAGDDGIRAMARVTAGGVLRDQVRWAANASFLARERAVLASTVAPGGNTVGNEVQVAAGAAYLAANRRLSVGPEVILSVPVIDLPSDQSAATIEAYASARYQLTDQVLLGGGIGTSLAGSGVPEARVLLSLAYAPTRTRRLSSFERVVVLPDEDGHVGGVEVDDGKTRTVLDRPYASTEVKADGRVRPVQATPQAVAQRTAALERSLPPSDRDRDGIVDTRDGCPERAGVTSDDPIRHGCPASREKVVVLPDADGHVGGVEVDDGTRKVVLDTPYASAEVASDGKVQAVPPASARSVERTVSSVARSLPPADADEDGIVDVDDACPARAGVRAADPIRHGCPAAAERVVVLPDADGHVGAVEIDDGKTRIVIDTPFGAAEVGVDGAAQAVPASPARAVERSIATLARAMPMADDDKDGIRDEQDACPDRAGSASTDLLRHGCPAATEKVVVLPDADGKVGAVEISDGAQTVVLDAAYATGEVRGGKVVRAPASPEPATVRAIATLSRAMPIADRDDDGIVDGDDACPDRAGRPSPQAVRHGCPRSVEQVVVLADENGHVGAVEVDDGQSKTVIDTAYGAAEVGIDGRVRTLPAEAADVSARYGDAMAARPPGARIILYFTERAEPVRDITGPVDNLVAEVKARTDAYTIDVIGHTDQTGSERANRRIGLERAQLIADRLIAAGIPRDRVRVTSMGSKEPAIKLKNRRVVELRNRRVEIWVK